MGVSVNSAGVFLSWQAYDSTYSDDSLYRRLYNPVDMYRSVGCLPGFSPGPVDPGRGSSDSFCNGTTLPVERDLQGLAGKSSLGVLVAARNIQGSSGIASALAGFTLLRPDKFACEFSLQFPGFYV